MRQLRRYTRRPFSRELGVLVVAVIWWIPFYFLVAIALRPTSDIFNVAAAVPEVESTLGNFAEAWKGGGRRDARTVAEEQPDHHRRQRL